MVHPKTERNPRGAGRKPKVGTAALRDKRRFFMLEKTDQTSALMKMAHAQYRKVSGKDTTDAEMIRWALRVVVGTVFVNSAE